MGLDPECRKYVEKMFDESDAALAERPNLAAVFDRRWRREFRERTLNAQSRADLSFPNSYAKPDQEFMHPEDYQDRLEQGLAILFPKFDEGERNHFVQRMRGDGCLSAEEELLLARGFADTFGANAITFPRVRRDQTRPEFHVSVEGRTIEIEAKGLLDSKEVQQLNESTARSGQHHWFSFSSTIGDIGRVRSAVAKKLMSQTTADGRILVLTQYTLCHMVDEVVPLLRDMALDPGQFRIPQQQQALAIAYVLDAGLRACGSTRRSCSASR